MSAKRWFVDKSDGNGRSAKTQQVGGGSKSSDKAVALRQRMREQQAKGSSASFSIREGRKR